MSLLVSVFGWDNTCKALQAGQNCQGYGFLMVIVGDVEDVVKFLARKEDELETLLYFTQYIYICHY
jgi:hypothetical protein